VITGDITQVDLPNPGRSGLIEAMNVLQGIEGIRFQMFSESDVVRHHLVQRIVRAYEDFRSRDDRQLSLQLEGETPRSAEGLASLEEKAAEPVPVRQ
jgi:phosphate starvation-inducible PhoH-like protein